VCRYKLEQRAHLRREDAVVCRYKLEQRVHLRREDTAVCRYKLEQRVHLWWEDAVVCRYKLEQRVNLKRRMQLCAVISTELFPCHCVGTSSATGFLFQGYSAPLERRLQQNKIPVRVSQPVGLCWLNAPSCDSCIRFVHWSWSILRRSQYVNGTSTAVSNPPTS
jgi:hypothetical protein